MMENNIARTLVTSGFCGMSLPSKGEFKGEFADMPKGMYTARNPDLSQYMLIVHKTDDAATTFAYASDYLCFPKRNEFVHQVYGNIDERWVDFYLATKSIYNYVENGAHRISHYQWLEAILPDFSRLVFGEKWNWIMNQGMIGAHGDKCYSYMSDALDDHDIPKWHTAMLFLLTYTKEMDREKHKSYEWIIDNYERYKPLLDQAEKESGI